MMASGIPVDIVSRVGVLHKGRVGEGDAVDHDGRGLMSVTGMKLGVVRRRAEDEDRQIGRGCGVDAERAERRADADLGGDRLLGRNRHRDQAAFDDLGTAGIGSSRVLSDVVARSADDEVAHHCRYRRCWPWSAIRPETDVPNRLGECRRVSWGSLRTNWMPPRAGPPRPLRSENVPSSDRFARNQVGGAGRRVEARGSDQDLVGLARVDDADRRDRESGHVAGVGARERDRAETLSGMLAREIVPVRKALEVLGAP